MFSIAELCAEQHVQLADHDCHADPGEHAVHDRR
jgi:hypothetical protein